VVLVIFLDDFVFVVIIGYRFELLGFIRIWT